MGVTTQNRTDRFYLRRVVTVLVLRWKRVSLRRLISGNVSLFMIVFMTIEGPVNRHDPCPVTRGINIRHPMVRVFKTDNNRNDGATTIML